MSFLESIPKFVIESPNRRVSFIGQQFREIGITYSSIDATFLDEFPQEFDPKESWAKSKRRLSLPELGTATSHRKCYEEIVASEIGCALVFEDDCQINNIEKFDQILKFLSQMDLSKAFVVSFFTKVASLKFSETYNTHLYSVVSEPSHAVCYFISNPAAKALLNANQNLTYVADWPKNSGVHFFLSKEKLIVTDIAKSFISEDRGSTNISNFQRFILMMSIFSGIHFMWFRKYFTSFQEFLSILILPPLQRKIVNVVSSSVPVYGNRVRISRKIGSGNNQLRATL